MSTCSACWANTQPIDILPSGAASLRVSPMIESQTLWPATARIRQLAALDENWDRGGSPALTPAAIAASLDILAELTGEDVPVPRVLPVPGGGLQLEWQATEKRLELEVLPDGSLLYLKCFGADFEEGETVPRRVRPLVYWAMM